MSQAAPVSELRLDGMAKSRSHTDWHLVEIVLRHIEQFIPDHTAIQFGC
jgi:hypothetical protein